MKNHGLNRRRFIRNASAGIIGAGLMGANAAPVRANDPMDEFPVIKAYRTLGRTGFKVSDISTGVVNSEGVLKSLLSCGVNLIETSEQYSSGKNESLIGSVIKDFDREKLFLATKVSHKVKEYESADDIIERANASLARLQINYIDCLMIHGAENSDRVKNKYFHKAVEHLRKEGKIRSVGVSCHGHSWWDNPEETFEQVLMTAIEDGRFDIIMLPYNYFQPEMGDRVLQACHDRNLGTMIMKSIPMYIYEQFREIKENLEKEGKQLSERYNTGYEKYKLQAEQSEAFFDKYGISGMEEMKNGAIKFILSNKNVSTICCEFLNFDDVKKYINLSGTTLTPETEEMLTYIKSQYGNQYCRIGCNLCEASCPHHIPVNTILRYNYYFQAKKQEKRAIQLYGSLQGTIADNCLNCEGFCERACPHGVLARPLLAAAHRNLSFDTPNFT